MRNLSVACLVILSGLAYSFTAKAESPEFTHENTVKAKVDTVALPISEPVKLTSETGKIEDNEPLSLANESQLMRAQVKARQSTQIASEMAGRISLLKIRDGERFSAGEILVGFHCSLEEAQLSKAKATLEKKRKTHEVNQKLENLKSISTLQLDVSRTEQDEAKADVNVAQAMLEKCVIKAPFSGKVVEVTARAHQSVRPGDPLLEIISEKDLEIEFIAPSKSLPKLKPGKIFKVNLTETSKAYDAKIIRLGGKVDPVSQTIKVYGRITGNTSEILPGMSGSIELPQSE